METIFFRPYHRDDLSACAGLAIDAWPTVTAAVSHESLKLMQAYVELSRLGSTWLEVACMSDRVVGLLFGLVLSDYTLPRQLKAGPGYLMVGIKFMLGQYGKISKPLTFLKHLRAAEAKASKLVLQSDAVVQLFVVSSECRGRGIGRTMLDRFVSAAQTKNARSISLYTDPLSNWRFYEIYGFTRSAVFDDDLNTYLVGKPMESYVYTLDLKQQALGGR